MDWETEAKYAHEGRIRGQQGEWEKREIMGENIYTDFCVWCNGYADEKAKIDPKVFAKFLKENNVQITERQREYIAINHFGYVYDIDKKKWVKG